MSVALLFALALVLAFPASAAADGPADQQFTFAVRLMKEGDRELAQDAFADFIRDYPRDRRVDDAFYYRALLARREGEPEQARRYLAKVDEPLNVDAAAVKLLEGQLALESGDTKQAVAAFEAIDADAFDDDQTRLTWHYLRGLAYERQGNPTAAATQFDQAAEAKSPIQGRALLALGKARIRLKQLGPAMEALRRAAKVAAAPGRAAEARRLAGELAYRQKQYEQAAALYRHIVENQQSADAFPDAVVGLLRSLLAAGQPEKLITRHKNLAEHIPADRLGEALYLKAAAHVKLKQYEEALDALDNYERRTEPGHRYADAARYLRGLSLFHSDPAAFERWYADAQPGGRELAYLRAAAAVQRDKPAEAIRHLGELVTPPDAPYAKRAMLQRAHLYDRLDQSRKAADAYATFAERYGDDPQARPVLRRAIDLAFSANRHERVIDLAKRWLEDARRPEPAAAVRLKLAVSLIRTEARGAAVEQLDAVLGGKPGDRVGALAHFYRGLVLANRVDVDKPATIEAAVEALGAALEGDLPETQETEALAMSARLNRLAGNEEAALSAYKRLRSIRSAGAFDPAVAVWVGRGMLEAGQAAEALPWLASVADNERVDQRRRAQAMFYQAKALAELERWRDAKEAYTRLLAVGDGAYGNQAQLGLAQALAASGAVRYHDALEEYNGLLNVRDTRVAATALYESAMIHLELAEQARRVDSEKGVRHHRTEARQRLSRLVLLYDAPQLGSLPLKAMHRLGRIHAEDGNIDAARKQFDKLIERDGKPAWALLGEAERKLLTDPPQVASARQRFKQVANKHAGTEVAGIAEKRLEEVEPTR